MQNARRKPMPSNAFTVSEHESVSQHLTHCSPCFNRYMEILADVRRKNARLKPN
jgi:hypothetical protein